MVCRRTKEGGNLMSRNQYETILFYYDIYPMKIEDYGKIKKIDAYGTSFALKETELLDTDIDRFIHSIRKLERKGYQGHVPIIPTKYGEYVVRIGPKVYYLMPWVENRPISRDITIEELMSDQLGIIHRLTIESVPLTPQYREKAYLSLLKRWEERQKIIEQFADIAEGNTYMSPFQLTFFTNYYYLKSLIEEAKKHLERWYEICEKKETTRRVLCHSRLSRQHVLLGEQNQPYLINFEKSTFDTPARDLALFFRHAFRYNLWDEEALGRWIAAYMRHNELLEEEKELLLAYLFFPEPVVAIVASYMNDPNRFTEIEYVQRFERRMMVMRKVQRLKGLILQ